MKHTDTKANLSKTKISEIYFAEEIDSLLKELGMSENVIRIIADQLKTQFTLAKEYIHNIELLLTDFSSFIPIDEELAKLKETFEQYTNVLNDITRHFEKILQKYKTLLPETFILHKDEIIDDLDKLNNRISFSVDQLQKLYLSEMQKVSQLMQEDFETEKGATLESLYILKSIKPIKDKATKMEIRQLLQKTNKILDRINHQVRNALEQFNHSLTHETPNIIASFTTLRTISKDTLLLSTITNDLKDALDKVASHIKLTNNTSKHSAGKILAALGALPKILGKMVKKLKAKGKV